MQQMVEMITGGDFRRMINGAYRTFIREHEGINSLNVFPVPDGDTGTNMMLTVGSVVKVLAQTSESEIGALSKRAADGAIMGARGNSGVILAQIFRGIAHGLRGKRESTSGELGKAFQYGILYAYRAVARPVEGTILTVAKGIAKGAHRAVRENLPFAEILAAAIDAGKCELARTPELLPVLKSAGVVDAGGQGLIAFLNGCLDGINGIDSAPEANFAQSLIAPSAIRTAAISHPYCIEFVVSPSSQTVEAAKSALEPLGESLVLACTESILKVHIHTARPGTVLESAITWGTLHDIKIDNMADQHVHRLLHAADEQIAKTAVVSVAAGAGLTDIMQRLGATGIVVGGDTMNPAVEDFLAAVHAGKAEHFILLPNNKNIMLTAVQAQKLMGESITVLPTVNIVQAIAALTAFDSNKDSVINIEAMTDSINKVKAGSLTTAVRDSQIDGRAIETGRYIGLLDGEIIADSVNMEIALYNLLEKMLVENSEVISLYYGADICIESAEAIRKFLETKFARQQLKIYNGGQPLYHFIVAVE